MASAPLRSGYPRKEQDRDGDERPQDPADEQHVGGPRSSDGVGVLWLAAAYLRYENLSWKNGPSSASPPTVGSTAKPTTQSTHPVLGVWTSTIENVVLPHFALFGWFTFLTESLLALLLALGLATRFWGPVWRPIVVRRLLHRRQPTG